MFSTRTIALFGLILWLVLPGAGRAEAPSYAIVPEAPDILAFARGKMAPAAPLVGAVGGRMSYRKGELAITRGDTTLRYRVGNAKMEWTQGRAKGKMDLPLAPFELNGELYLPFLSLVAALDGMAAYNAEIPGYIVTLGESTLRLREIPLKIEPSHYREAEPQWYLLSLDGAELTRLTYGAGMTGLPAVSPAGDALAFARSGALYLRDTGKAEAEVLLPANYDGIERTYSTPCFTHDGQAILFTKHERNAGEEKGRETVGIVQRDGTGEATLTAGSDPRPVPGERVTGPVTVLSNRGNILRGGAKLGLKPGMILFPIRRQSVSGMLKVVEVNPDDSHAETLVDSRGIAPGDRAFPPSQFFTYTLKDEQTGAFWTGLALTPQRVPNTSGLIRATDVTVEEHKAAISNAPPFPLEGASPVFAPDGLTVAWTASPVGNAVIKYAHITGSTVRSVAAGHSPVFSPDGKQIAFIDANSNLMLVDRDGKNARTLHPSWQGRAARPAFTPDGEEVLFLKNDQLCAIKPDEKTARVLAKDLAVRDYVLCSGGKHLLLSAIPAKP
jgi:Tol biopolymer transport system component